jgi:hypothetical protein
MIYIGVANFLFLLRYALSGFLGLSRYVYYLILIGLFLFSAYRFQVGCDWSGYYYQYMASDYYGRQYVFNNNEPIWWWILQWLKARDFVYPAANVVSSAIFFIGTHVLARKQPDPLGFLVLLFPILIINMPMSGIRQGAAIGLICIAFAAFIDRKPIWFAFWVALAAGFHSSALVFALLLPLTVGRYTTGRLLMAAILAVPGAIFLASGDSAEMAADRYIGTGIDAFGAIYRVGIMALSGAYFFYFVRKKWMRKFPADYSLASIGAIGMLITLILLPVSSVIVDRFAYYLIPIQAMIFARLPFLRFKANRNIHVAAPYIGLLIVFVAWTQTSAIFERCYVPYQSWIFGMPEGDILRFRLGSGLIAAARR